MGKERRGRKWRRKRRKGKRDKKLLIIDIKPLLPGSFTENLLQVIDYSQCPREHFEYKLCLCWVLLL